MIKKLVLGLIIFAGAILPATAQVVAIGTSFTQGYGVGSTAAYPALLEAALRRSGYNVTVRNEGVYGDTAPGGLARLNSAVPNGTRVAIVEFGVNELAGHAGNPAALGPALQAIGANLRSRGIQTIFVSLRGAAQYAGGSLGPVVQAPARGHRDPRTGHPDATVHQAVAQALTPLVAAALGRR